MAQDPGGSPFVGPGSHAAIAGLAWTSRLRVAILGEFAPQVLKCGLDIGLLMLGQFLTDVTDRGESGN